MSSVRRHRRTCGGRDGLGQCLCMKCIMDVSSTFMICQTLSNSCCLLTALSWDVLCRAYFKSLHSEQYGGVVNTKQTKVCLLVMLWCGWTDAITRMKPVPHVAVKEGCCWVSKQAFAALTQSSKLSLQTFQVKTEPKWPIFSYLKHVPGLFFFFSADVDDLFKVTLDKNIFYCVLH